MEDASRFLNSYVAPNNLISISIFEDDHPCDNNIYHMVILHKGKCDKVVEKKEIHGDVFSLNFTSSDKGWENMCEDIAKEIERDGFS